MFAFGVRVETVSSLTAIASGRARAAAGPTDCESSSSHPDPGFPPFSPVLPFLRAFPFIGQQMTAFLL